MKVLVKRWALVTLVGVLGSLSPSLAGEKGDAKKPVETFIDRGEVFARAGESSGLTVGTVLKVLGPRIGDTDERRAVGSATVMEVWETLARLKLDAEAEKHKGERFVALPKEQSQAEASPTQGPPRLRGHAEFSGLVKRLVVYNDGPGRWTGCELRFPNNKRYLMPKLEAGDSETVMLMRFEQDGVPRALPLDWVRVRCKEGEARFSLKSWVDSRGRGPDGGADESRSRCEGRRSAVSRWRAARRPDGVRRDADHR